MEERWWEACRTGKFGAGMLETGAVEDISTYASELELGLPTSLVAQGPRDIEAEKRRELFLTC